MTWLIRRASISGFFLGHFLFTPAPVYSLRICVLVQGFCKKKKNCQRSLCSSAVPTAQALITAPTHSTYIHICIPKLRQMQAVQLLVMTKACRPIRSYRLISIQRYCLNLNCMGGGARRAVYV